MQLARGLHLIPGLAFANACLVTEPEVALFDCGLPGEGSAVLSYLAELGLAPADLQVIALTHADPDHAGAAPWLRRNSAARIVASPAEARVASGESPLGLVRWAWRAALGISGRRVESFAVDGSLEPGDTVAGFVTVATPGHTDGHLSFFREEDGVLIAGDAVRVGGQDILAPGFWDSQNELTCRLSVAALADLPVHLLIPGHGAPYREPAAGLRRAGGPPGFVDELLARREHRRSRSRRK